MNNIDLKYKKMGYKLICGIDEVGRGCLAGSCVVCGVILHQNIEEIRDSKKLSKKKIATLAKQIKENSDYIIVEKTANEIDKFGIKNVVVDAMNEITEKLQADFYLIDFEKVKKLNSESLVKGDQKSMSIAAASIVAKDYRDKKMIDLAVKYPMYYFDNHVGYGTIKHLSALNEFGYIKGIHRRTYKPVAKINKVYNDEI